MSASKSENASRLRSLEIWSAVSALTLLAGTYRLWFPTSDFAFPQIPLFETFCGWPLWADYALSTCLITGWLLILCGWRTLGCATVILAGVWLVCLNQHRLQPWLVQLLVFAFVFGVVSNSMLQRMLRVFVVSIYLFSALGKLDYEFLHTVGQQFLGQLLRFASLETVISESARKLLVLVIPAGELALALGLVFTKTSRWAGVGVCVMHCLLLLILGPWGLNHSWGVLLWNVHFVGAAVLLFVWPGPTFADAQSTGPQSRQDDEATSASSPVQLTATDWLVAALLFPVLFMPLFERFGWWDHWPSWALYAPHSSRVEVYVARTAVDRLPESLQPLVPATDEGTLWVRVPLATWSLESLQVPVYPQARFQLGVARSLATRLSEFEIRAEVLGVASRFNGRRTGQRMEGLSSMRQAGHQYLFSTVPRQEDIN